MKFVIPFILSVLFLASLVKVLVATHPVDLPDAIKQRAQAAPAPTATALRD